MNIYFIVASLLPNADIIRLNAEVARLNTDNARLNDNAVQLNALVDKLNYDIETLSMFVCLGHDNHPLDDIDFNLRNDRHQSLWDRDIEW